LLNRSWEQQTGPLPLTQNLAKEVEKEKKENLERLINNDHVWTAADV